MTSIIKTQDLTKTYVQPGVKTIALKDIHLSVEHGEFVAIMGPSGCGKSTLLHLLGGLDQPTSGEIQLAGQRVDGLTETEWARLRRRKVGFMFQAFNLISNLTVSDNVELPALIAGYKLGEVHARRKDILKRLGLTEKTDSVPTQLSGGQQQRVALARAMINQPDLLLADEPTGNLDSQNTVEVLQLLREANLAGQTIVLVTHDPQVAQIASRVIHMRDGAILN